MVPEEETTSFAMLGMRIKEILRTEWKDKLEADNNKSRPYTYAHSYRKLFKWEVRSKLRTPQGTPRKIASAFYQLKIGHGYFKSYLHKRNHSINDKCRCGRKETPEHLLLSCPETGDARKTMKDALQKNLTLELLLHSTDGVTETLKFINTTKIATRSWHLSRDEEELPELGQPEQPEQEVED
jgi:hypothetical protein